MLVVLAAIYCKNIILRTDNQYIIIILADFVHLTTEETAELILKELLLMALSCK